MLGLKTLLILAEEEMSSTVSLLESSCSVNKQGKTGAVKQEQGGIEAEHQVKPQNCKSEIILEQMENEALSTLFAIAVKHVVFSFVPFQTSLQQISSSMFLFFHFHVLSWILDKLNRHKALSA